MRGKGVMRRQDNVGERNKTRRNEISEKENKHDVTRCKKK